MYNIYCFCICFLIVLYHVYVCLASCSGKEERLSADYREVGLRELCSKFSSLFYSEFPQKLYHYYAQNLLIILNILNFTGEFLQLFFTFAIKNFENAL